MKIGGETVKKGCGISSVLGVKEAHRASETEPPSYIGLAIQEPTKQKGKSPRASGGRMSKGPATTTSTAVTLRERPTKKEVNADKVSVAIGRGGVDVNTTVTPKKVVVAVTQSEIKNPRQTTGPVIAKGDSLEATTVTDVGDGRVAIASAR